MNVIVKEFLEISIGIANGDESLEKGVEVVSPILTGDMQENSNQIKQVCQTLKTFGQKTSERCRWTYTYRFRLFNNTAKLDEFD